MSVLYRAQATALGGRVGSVASADGRLRLELSMPGPLGGEGGSGTNPEQLLAAAIAACLLDGIRDAAGRDGVRVTHDSNVTAAVELTRREDGSSALGLTLSVDLPGIDTVTAEGLVASARRGCALTSALGGGMDVRTWVA